MTIRMIAAALLALGLAGHALAETTSRGPVVVELYTSQGCSSCPPADALLDMMADDPDVIALALHVDYWDYLGWADSFADPAFTRRQKAYAHVAGARSVYTPQMIVGGKDHIVGVKPAELAGLIAGHAQAADAVVLQVERTGGTLVIRATPVAPLRHGAIVQVVGYRREATVEIRGGENNGRTIRYANIVDNWKPVAEWDGRAPLVLEVKAPGNGPAAVIVQEPGPGAILAAAKLR
jgi:hypothetical protein